MSEFLWFRSYAITPFLLLPHLEDMDFDES
jgi:hypothetical protein